MAVRLYIKSKILHPGRRSVRILRKVFAPRTNNNIKTACLDRNIERTSQT